MKASKSIKSKQILLSALVVLVLVAGYYRWTKDSAVENIPVVSDAIPEENDGKQLISENADFFEKSRYDRDLARSEVISVLNDFAEENISEDEKRENEKKISESIEKGQKETTIENLIISKGFEDCIVFIEDNISVVVKAESLDSKSVNQIKDIVLAQTDYKASQIRISNKTK